MEAIIDMMVAEAIKTSEIEGEYLSPKDVLSSIRKNLGLINNPDQIQDKKAEGIGELQGTCKTLLIKMRLCLMVEVEAQAIK